MIIRRKRNVGTAPVSANDQGPAARELIDMDQAIALLATTRPTFYRWLRSGQFKGMKVGRQWRFYRDDIERYLKGQGPRIELRADIMPLITALRQRLEQLGGKDTTSETSEVAHAVMLMILLASRMRASDFHLEPRDRIAVLRYRLDGVLHPVAEFDLRLLPAVIEQWKTMAACDVHEKVKPQDGVIILTPPGDKQEMKLRLRFLPAIQGDSLAVLILSMWAVAVEPDIAQLGFDRRDQARLRTALSRPWGLVVVTSPAGTGKTTTLYSCLTHLISPERKIITIEDPVECTFAGTTQVQIKPEAGLSMAVAMRAAMRSAPNIIMIGEIRDSEVCSLCLQEALIGSLVLTTLHTSDAPSALKRLVDLGAAPHIVADTTTLVIAQRLVRKLCPHCSKEQANPPFLDRAMELAKRGELDWATLSPRFRQPGTCRKCNLTGYAGRILIAEVLEMTPELAAAVRRGASLEEIRTLAVGQGMTTLAADGIRKAAAGLTTIEEVVRTVGLGAY